jgi:hypothetical protein
MATYYEADRVNVTIGTIYKSGSAIVATTGTGSGRKSGQCHCGHPREQQDKRSGYWSKISRSNRQCQYDHRYTNNEQEADSAIVAIRENNKQQLELQESTVSR